MFLWKTTETTVNPNSTMLTAMGVSGELDVLQNSFGERKQTHLSPFIIQT